MQEEEEFTPEELAQMLEGAKPTSMVKLSPTEDWIVTAWCFNCEAHHHYLVTHCGKKRKKPFDGFQVVLPQTKDGNPAAKGDGQLHRLAEKFVSVDDAGDVIEEVYSGADDEDDED